MKIIKTKEISGVGIAHNPEIMKKVFVENGEVPALTTFASATFKPGQSVEEHQHETMYEIFYITEGSARFTILDNATDVHAGDCIIIEPGEMHLMENPTDNDVTWLYFGIAID
jgi:quercetin dioxygenase-like cupin family protein